MDGLDSSTLTFAGHETTASTLTWLLYELCNHPEHQKRIRQEIAEVRTRVGAEDDLSSTDYDSMPFMNAAIKVLVHLSQLIL